MTSNIGLESLNKWATAFGFSENLAVNAGPNSESVKNEVMRQVQEHFRIEFLNRIDKIVVFEPLSREHLKKVVKLELGKLQKQLAELGIKLKIESPALDH